jgi:hypothetical protein
MKGGSCAKISARGFGASNGPVTLHPPLQALISRPASSSVDGQTILLRSSTAFLALLQRYGVSEYTQTARQSLLHRSIMSDIASI